MNAENGEFEVADDINEVDQIEDRGIDSLEDAIDLLADDNTEEISEIDGEEEADEANEASEVDDNPEADLSDAVIELPNGETLTVAELEGYRANGLREADYTRKSMELSEDRKSFESDREAYAKREKNLETAIAGFQEFLKSVIPPEPSLALAEQDMQKYQLELIRHQRAMNELQPFLEMKQQAQDAFAEINQEEVARYRSNEEAKLFKAMPHLKDPVKHTAFMEANAKTAKEFGFSEQEFADTHDHRLLSMVHFARIGKIADQNRRNAARRVETPKKGKSKPAQVTSNEKSRKAMQRLSKSGSFEDAMQIDF